MDFKTRHRCVEELIEECDYNLYEASNLLAKRAIENKRSAYWSISNSEAISWALTGEAPEDIDDRIRQHMRVYTSRNEYMRDLLGYISDDDIVEAVQMSFNSSMNIGHLIFCYGNVKDKDKVRVRVLTRMCWFNKDLDPLYSPDKD